MLKTPTVAAVALGLALGMSGAVCAQITGAEEYANSCAQCHGVAGTGDGPLAGYLNTQMPDLTRIQSENGGVFPVTAIYRIIDGSETSGAHGTSEMPAWGDRFQFRGARVANPDFRDEEAATYARFRILALIEYLASIQQD
jgi:mono/diheme cytochrome c family protein